MCSAFFCYGEGLMHNLYFPISFAVVYFYMVSFLIHILPELSFPHIFYLLYTAFSPLLTVLLIQQSTDNVV